MHAMFSADTERYSPYSPSSRLFLNSLYASPTCILGEREVRNAIETLGLADELHTLEQLNLIDWPAAAKPSNACCVHCMKTSVTASTRNMPTS
jgi:4-alpha-glucanotransferase